MCPALEGMSIASTRRQTSSIQQQTVSGLVLVFLVAYVSGSNDNVPRHSFPATLAAAEYEGAATKKQFHRCGTQSPTKAWQYHHQHTLQQQKDQSRVLLSQFPKKSDAGHPRRHAKLLGVTSEASRQSVVYTIPTHVHVVMVTDPGIATGNVTMQAIIDQLAVINSAYSVNADRAGLTWDFQLVNVTYTTTTLDSDMCKPGSEAQLKQRLRQGGNDALNLYLTDLSACGVLGWSTWPWDTTDKVFRLALDGVVVHFDTLPGGDYTMYNLGGTAAHETGHWLGLFHSFENGCVPPGDNVDDTPYCTVPDNVHCPAHRDSCPQPGEDPGDNLMGYGVDSCMKTLTVGQQMRLEQMWKRYRAVKAL